MRRTLLGVAAVVLAVPGCSAGGDHPVAVPAPSVPARTATSGFGAAPPPAGALNGRRQVLFLPRLDDHALPDSALALTTAGRLQVVDDWTDRALFVPVPKGGGAPERLIKTGALRDGGRPLCLQVGGPGAEPATVVAAACDTAEPGQLFLFEADAEDDEGRTTYLVRNRGAVLQWHPLGGAGLRAEEPGDASPATTFSLMDQGAAALPG